MNNTSNYLQSDIFGYFLEKTFYPNQQDILTQIQQAFRAGKKVVLLEAGTGIGKSIIMRTTAGWLEEAHICTMQKALQEDYVNHGSQNGNRNGKLPQVQGRNSHTCIMNPSVKCHEARCVQDKEFRCVFAPRKPITDKAGNVLDKGLPAFESAKRGYFGWFSDKHCLYWQQKADAINSRIVVHNYAYLLTETNYIGDFGTKELLGCDECHNIKKVLSSFVGFTANIKKLKDYCRSIELENIIEFKDYGTDIAQWVEFCEKCLAYFKAEYSVLTNLLKNQNQSMSSHSGREYTRLKADLEEVIPRLERFIGEYIEDPGNWVINVKHGNTVGEVESIELKPIDVSKYADKYLFNLGNKMLLMSATILDPVKFCNELGIPLKDVYYINSPSPFDPARAPIYAMNIGKLNNKNFSDFITEIADCIDSIMNIHDDQKGIIHCTSGRNRDLIMLTISPKNRERMIAPTAGTKKMCMEKHTASTNSVLITISDEEGIDLKDNLSRFQIVTSLPFGNLGDAQVAARQERDPEGYNQEMLIRLIQECGRSNRNMNDYAFTYVLPSQFAWYIKKFDAMFQSKSIYPSSFATFKSRIKWNKEGLGRKII